MNINFAKISVQSIIKHSVGNQIRINFNPWDLLLEEDDKTYHLSRAISIIIQDFEFINLNELVFFNISKGVISPGNLKEFTIKDLMNNYQFKKVVLEELEKNNIIFLTDEEISELYSNDITLLNYDIIIYSLKEKIEQSLIDKDKESFMDYTNQMKHLNVEKEILYQNQLTLTEKDKNEIDYLFKELDSMFEESKLNVILDKALLNKDEKLFNQCIKEYEKLKAEKLKGIDK